MELLHNDTNYYFGHCPDESHENTYLNVGKTHWMFCEKCGIRWCVGANLFSSWRRETEQQWAANEDRLLKLTEVK